MPKQSSMPSVKEIEQLFNSNRKVWAANERRRKAQEKKRREEEAARQEARARQRRALRRQRAAAPPPAPPPVVSGIGRVRAPRQPIYANSLVKLATGRTKVQPGSLRDKVLGVLRRAGEPPMTLAQLAEHLSFDPKPVVAKLRDAGWVEVT